MQVGVNTGTCTRVDLHLGVNTGVHACPYKWVRPWACTYTQV